MEMMAKRKNAHTHKCLSGFGELYHWEGKLSFPEHKTISHSNREFARWATFTHIYTRKMATDETNKQLEQFCGCITVFFSFYLLFSVAPLMGFYDWCSYDCECDVCVRCRDAGRCTAQNTHISYESTFSLHMYRHRNDFFFIHKMQKIQRM